MRWVYEWQVYVECDVAVHSVFKTYAQMKVNINVAALAISYCMCRRLHGTISEMNPEGAISVEMQQEGKGNRAIESKRYEGN